MEQGQDRSWVAVEFFVGSQVLSGYLSISAGRRLLDMLNKLGDHERDVNSDYVEFTAAAESSDEEPRRARYVRKSAVELAAVSEPDLARGAGAETSPDVYPRVEKSTVHVSLEMVGYSLEGTMHTLPGRTIRDVLDEKAVFLPLTDVTIARENHLYGTRPFVAIKKEQIISLKEEKMA